MTTSQLRLSMICFSMTMYRSHFRLDGDEAAAVSIKNKHATMSLPGTLCRANWEKPCLLESAISFRERCHE
jgi:hypothetical protein